MGLFGFTRAGWFKYLKNLLIGVGAALVMLGALYKIQSWDMNITLPIVGKTDFLTIGLMTEAFIFLFLGVIGPDPDYYWEKLYPGLDKYYSKVSPIKVDETSSLSAATSPALPGLDGDRVDQQLSGMLAELQTMSRSMSSLKALQEADFSGVSDQIAKVNQFYSSLNEAMANISDSLDDTRQYKEQLSALNKNLGSLNSVYGGMLSAMSNIGRND